MKYKQCSYRGCSKILEDGVAYCDYHAKIVDEKNKQRHREYYYRTREDECRKKNEKFYKSKEWITLSNLVKQHFLGECVVCNAKGIKTKSDEVLITHHIEPISERDDLKLDKDNLVCVCSKHHNMIHADYNKSDVDEARAKRLLYELVKLFNEKYY